MALARASVTRLEGCFAACDAIAASLFLGLREQLCGEEEARQYVVYPKRQYVTAHLFAEHKTVSCVSSRLVVLNWR
jgi:hypothetical protein